MTSSGAASTWRVEIIAQAVIIAAPVLAFDVVPVPGIVTLGLIVPASLLVIGLTKSSKAWVTIWPLALVGWLALSVVWGDDPAYSAERLRTYLPLALTVCVAGCLLTSEQILRSLRISFATIITSSLVVLLLDPSSRSLGDEFVLHAQFDKNTYGGLLAFALVLTLVKPRRVNLFVVPALLTLIAFNRSVTIWVICAAFIFTVMVGRIVFRLLPGRAGLVPFCSIVFSTLAVVSLLLRLTTSAALDLVGKDPGLTLRTEVWAACWPHILDAPMLGHGAFTFLDAGSNSPVTQAVWLRFTQYLPPHAHNGLLDLWGQLGLIGVAVFAGLVISAIRSCAVTALEGSEPALTAMLGIIFILTFGVTEPTYLNSWAILTYIVVAMAAAAAAASRPSLIASPSRDRLTVWPSPNEELIGDEKIA